jgi:hypothetical protein
MNNGEAVFYARMVGQLVQAIDNLKDAVTWSSRIWGICAPPDEYKDYGFPCWFVAVPRIGDKISGKLADKPDVNLYVKSIEHVLAKDGRPAILIGLHPHPLAGRI